MSKSIKGNSGKARMWRRYLPWVVVLVVGNVIAAIVLYQTVWSYTPEDLESVTLKDDQMILEKYWTLIDLDVSSMALRKTSSTLNRYGRVR